MTDNTTTHRWYDPESNISRECSADGKTFMISDGEGNTFKWVSRVPWDITRAVYVPAPPDKAPWWRFWR